MDKNFNRNYRGYQAFSFVENIIVMVVLLIIFVISLPKLITVNNKQNAQLAVRKAVTNYQVVLTKELAGAQNVKDTDSFDRYLKTDSYENIVDRFDVVEKNCNKDSCLFTTSNGELWNVSTPSRTIVSINENDSPVLSLANDDTNDSVFSITYELINGNLKILLTKDDNYKNAAIKTKDFITGE